MACVKPEFKPNEGLGSLKDSEVLCVFPGLGILVTETRLLVIDGSFFSSVGLMAGVWLPGVVITGETTGETAAKVDWRLSSISIRC